MKRWTKILLIVLAVIVLAVASIPLFVNANTFRPAIERALTSTLGRSVKLGNLSLPVFSGSLVAKDVSVADDPDFSSAPYMTAKELRIGVSLRPLIFSHQLDIRSFQINSPQINMIRAADGTWNFSSIGRVAASTTPSPASENSNVPVPLISQVAVGLIVIEDGRVTITSLPAHGAPSEYEHVNLTAHDFLFGSRIPFELTANLPAGGSANVSGRVGPISRENAAITPFDVLISAKHIDAVGAGLLDPGAGVSFLADIDMSAKYDGQILTTAGTTQVQNLVLHKGAPADTKPLALAFSGTHNLKENTGRLDDVSIKIGDAAVHTTGTYQANKLDAENPLLNLKVVGQGVPIDELKPLIAAAAIRLPNGSTLKGGTLSMNLAVTGTPKALVIRGPIALDNTSLVGFDVSSKIHGIASLGGMKTGDTTHFEKLHVRVHVSDAGVTADNIDAIIEGIGQLTGSGTISPDNQLDFNLIAKVESAKGVGKVGMDVITGFSGSGVPMHVTGTPDDPYITANVGNIVGKTTKPFTSIFHKKK